MPLAEIPGGHIRKNGQVTQHQNASRQNGLRQGHQNGDENYEPSQKPFPFRNMLKNATEIGDVGQFSVKPPRVPLPSPKISPALSNKTRRTPSKSRAPASPYNGRNGYNGPSSSDNLPQGSTTFNSPGLPVHGHRRPNQRPSFEDFQSYSMTQGTYDSHSLTQRHPFVNDQPYGRGDINNVRPRSPYAYPTRLKRPGGRSSSPALSELNKSMTVYYQGLGRKPSSRTASPLSTYHMKRSPSPFRPAINHSDPDLQHYPPYLAMEPKRRRSPSAAAARPITPKQSLSVTSVSSSSRIYRQSSIATSIRTRPRSPPISPIFYDYTEEFENNGDPRKSNLSSEGVLIEHPELARNSGNSFDLQKNSDDDGTTEPSADNSPQKSISDKQEVNPNQSIGKFESNQIIFNPMAHPDLSDVPELPEKEIAADCSETSPEADRGVSAEGHHNAQSFVVPQILGDGGEGAPSNESRLKHSPQEFIIEGTYLREPGVLDEATTSPTRSVLAKSGDLPEPRPDALALPTTHLQLDLPAMDEKQKELSSKEDMMQPAEFVRGPSFEGHSRVSTEILSPTPERSIISPRSRDRFSKILSIDENVLDLEPLPAPPRRDERMENLMQGKNSIETWENNGTFGPFRRKRSLFLRNSPLKHSVASHVPVEGSDSEEEPELTVALRQTFCKDDKPIPQLRHLSSVVTTPPQWIRQQLGEPARAENVSIPGDVPADSSPSLQDLPSKTLTSDVAYDDIPAPPALISDEKQFSDQGKNSLHVPRKQPSFRSYSPPPDGLVPDLPLDFIPLVRQETLDDQVVEVEAIPPSSPDSDGTIHDEQKTQVMDSELGDRSSMASQIESLGSRPTSRPWNQDSSYPWNDEPPALDVQLPQGKLDSQKLAEKPPRFKLMVQRASSSAGVTNKLQKEFSRPETFRSPAASSFDLGEGPSFRRKRDPNLLLLHPGAINSSHDVIHSSRQKTRFVETFETQSPTVSTLLPSPEARSFFSDDSSQFRPKGGLRRRFSEFRARAATNRATSMDEARGYDRGLLSSALGRSWASGRSSRQSQNTADVSTRTSLARRVGWKVVDKIRHLLHRGEDKVRDWGWKMRYRNGKSRSASAPLYPGA